MNAQYDNTMKISKQSTDFRVLTTEANDSRGMAHKLQHNTFHYLESSRKAESAKAAEASTEGIAASERVASLEVGVHSLVPVIVVHLPLLVVCQHLVGLRHRREHLSGILVVLVQIWVVLLRQLSVRLLYLVFAGRLAHTKD